MSAALFRVLRGCTVGVSGGRRCSCSFNLKSSGPGLLALRRPTTAAFYGGAPVAGWQRSGVAMQMPLRRGLAMRMNDEIRATTVRVVDMSGDDLGVLSREDALAAAEGE